MKGILAQRSLISISFLLLVNLCPLYGVLFLGWNYSQILLIFLIETLVIAIFTIIKMSLASKLYDKESAKANPDWIRLYNTKSKLIKMYFLFISVFIALPFIAILAMNFNIIHTEIINSYKLLVLFLVITISSHTLSFFINYLPNERDKIYISSLFNLLLFRRIMPLFLSIFLLIFLSPIVTKINITVCVLLLKTAFDFMGHLKEHSSD